MSIRRHWSVLPPNDYTREPTIQVGLHGLHGARLGVNATAIALFTQEEALQLAADLVNACLVVAATSRELGGHGNDVVARSISP